MAQKHGPLPTFKIVVIGDQACGKTTFIHKTLTGQFHSHYHPTPGVEVHPYCLDTTHGRVCLNLWDCACALHSAASVPATPLEPVVVSSCST